MVHEARQEGKIEKDLRAIADEWASTTFTVVRYARGGVTPSPSAPSASSTTTSGGAAAAAAAGGSIVAASGAGGGSCPVLRAADDVKLKLDDALLNLQVRDARGGDCGGSG